MRWLFWEDDFEWMCRYLEWWIFWSRRNLGILRETNRREQSESPSSVDTFCSSLWTLLATYQPYEPIVRTFWMLKLYKGIRLYNGQYLHRLMISLYQFLEIPYQWTRKQTYRTYYFAKDKRLLSISLTVWGYNFHFCIDGFVPIFGQRGVKRKRCNELTIELTENKWLFHW